MRAAAAREKRSGGRAACRIWGKYPPADSLIHVVRQIQGEIVEGYTCHFCCVVLYYMRKFKTEGVADPYIKAWYPSETLNWDECELGKLLSSVVELELEVVDNNIEFPENPTDLLKELKNDSITNKIEGTTKLDVIYSSEIIKQTLNIYY